MEAGPTKLRIQKEKALEATDILATLRPPTKRFNRRCRCVQRLPEIVKEETHYVNIIECKELSVCKSDPVRERVRTYQLL
ncbi:hypothetical protein TcasGA2_TC016419 [Tribolium castaneum]|uniref:Uncharacterized protein n=1 Tax=Tribolium castaneum TaxID=7070 RepID=D7EL18_TRICA|nr:hypothetical protein TcasGA2_TC016419 [Tribolium castaneum]